MNNLETGRQYPQSASWRAERQRRRTGIWIRRSRGEFEYDGEYKNQYNFFQMGYDWAANDWHYGAAIRISSAFIN